MCACGYVHTNVVPVETRKGALDPLELELQAVLNCLTWFQELNLGPLEERSILVAAEPSF